MINTDCEYIVADLETNCKNCGCDDGPSRVSKCGEKTNSEKIDFTCSLTASGKGIWHPVVDDTNCQSNGEQYRLDYFSFDCFHPQA